MSNERFPQLQQVLQSSIRDTAYGEAIHFEFSLGPFQMKFVVNVPEEGKPGSTVYVKIGMEPNDYWKIFDRAAYKGEKRNEKEESGSSNKD